MKFTLDFSLFIRGFCFYAISVDIANVYAILWDKRNYLKLSLAENNVNLISYLSNIIKGFKLAMIKIIKSWLGVEIFQY